MYSSTDLDLEVQIASVLDQFNFTEKVFFIRRHNYGWMPMACCNLQVIDVMYDNFPSHIENTYISATGCRSCSQC